MKIRIELDFQIEISKKIPTLFQISRLKFWSGSWFPDDDFASASWISRRRPLTSRRKEEEETAVGVDFLAEADLTPLTPATIYHFPGTFSFSSREKAGTKFPRISFRSPTLQVELSAITVLVGIDPKPLHSSSVYFRNIFFSFFFFRGTTDGEEVSLEENHSSERK